MIDINEHIIKQIADFRRLLLGLTLRNPLLSCPHGQSVKTQVRIVDELPDAVFDRLTSDGAFEFEPLPEPRNTPDDEDDEEFKQALSDYKRSNLTYQQALKQLKQSSQGTDHLEELEREARDYARLLLERGKWEPEQGLSPEALARRHGINPSYELPSSDQEEQIERHHDDALQTLFSEQDLIPRLRRLRERARSDLRDRGVGTLFAAFGFLEWYEDDASQRSHFAPLVLVPVELDRASRNNRQVYKLRATDEKPKSNATLAEYLNLKFEVELPELTDDDSPESYFKKIEGFVSKFQRWRMHRFLTIHIFSDAKLAIYTDLDWDAWPDDDTLSKHDGIRQLMSETGVADVGYAEGHDIDGDQTALRFPTLICDADSSQHNAIVDALDKGNLTIYGPPGTGKSQTITNLIAAALDAGKTVLFVAEKLTALDVVHKKLCEAGLDRFCFVLHSGGIRREAVRQALRQRVDAMPPDFDQATYENLRNDWETQRNALKLYASVMGDRIGELGITVHEVLWEEIRRREAGKSLSPTIAMIRLPKTEALALTANGLQGTKRKIYNLMSAHEALGESGARPWRGIMGANLPPTEVDPTLHRLATWRESVNNLAAKAACLSDTIDPMSLDGIDQVIYTTTLLVEYAELGRKYELTALATKDTQRAVIAANAAAKKASIHALTIRERFRLDPTELSATVEDYRAIAVEASALDCAEQIVGKLASVAEADRLKADELVQVNSAIESLCRLFDITEPEAGSIQNIVQAMTLIRQTPRSLLLSRKGEWVEEGAHMRLAELEASVKKTCLEGETLDNQFNMKELPFSTELRLAGQRLKQSRTPRWLSLQSRRAVKLYRGIARERVKTDTETMANDLLRLAGHADEVASLLADEKGNALFNDRWQGVETDFREAMEVADWAAAIARDFSGIGDGRAEIRHTLLYGGVDILDEIVHVVNGLGDLCVESHQPTVGCPIADPNDLKERALRIDTLADLSKKAGLPEGFQLSNTNAVADLIAQYRREHAAAQDIPVPRLDGGTATNDETTGNLAKLCSTIHEKELTPEVWRAANKAYAEYGPDKIGEWLENLRNAVIEEKNAWHSWASPLEVNETKFFDSVERNAIHLGTIRQRADECLDGGNTIIEWCRYRRLWDDILNTEAKPLLESLDQNQIDVGQLPIAYEMALYRSLASIIFHKYPRLEQLTGEQLRNHKQAYCETEENLQKLECARIANELHHRPVERGISTGPPGTLTERALINYQLDLRRASVSPRDLISRSGKALRQLKPCFMMSPTTVSELLPRESELFDLVVIDEASQVLPADALGAIARAKSTVIVGDPQQLPPTTFFQGVVAGADGDDGIATASESILDLAMSAWRPHRHLRWHYRSRHSALIQFSNSKFYDNRLLVFPGPDEGASDDGVNFRYIDNGIYLEDRTNILEAERIVEAVLAFTADRDNWKRSLAVVTMNQPQRELLDEMLDKAASENDSLVGYIRRWDNELEPFTVKNLESVQGDERDVIFISTVYGPRTPGGPVSQQFGPIIQQGGERRLNVLFTRARWRIDLFSSMRANDIQPRPGAHRGIEILRDYLEYAATGRIETGEPMGEATESPFEEHVKEMLEAAGYDITPQVGVAGYRIDLGVKHTDYPDGFLLGIECDGATYHSAKSVRDRDRLREAVLRGLGWDIYRIWSTDWFSDTGREMGRLLDYLQGKLAEFRAGREDGEPDLEGTVVEEVEVMDEVRDITGEAIVDRDGYEDASDGLLEPEIVEVGDTVFYRRNVNDAEVRKVVIVAGPNDPDKGMINETKPFARAVLGRCRGEMVTINQPNSHAELVIERVFKGQPPAGDEMLDSGQSELFPGDNGMRAYRGWRGSAPDPRSISTKDLANTLREIIETEGPILTDRLYRVYMRSSSLGRAGRQVRASLNQALKRLENQGIVTIERNGLGSGYAEATIRMADSPTVLMRDRGDRNLDEIPIDELAQVYRLIRSESHGGDEDSIFREVLARYGLTRMTENVRGRLKEAAQQI